MSNDETPKIQHKDFCPLGFPEPDDEDIRLKRRREFRKNEDPKIDEYARQPAKPRDSDIERYLKECHKYRVAPICLVIAFLQDPESVKLNLSLQIIGEILAVSPRASTLQEIDFSSNFFDVNACYALSDLIQGPSLQVLNLANCHFGAEAAFLLAEGLTATTTLRWLDLSNCNLRDQGGQVILSALKESQSCLTLRLARNRLSTMAGQELGRFFKVNNILQELDLDWNELYDCVVPFLKGLLKNTSLRALSLAWNALRGADFVGALCKVIIKHPSLSALDLSNNLLKDSEAQKLTKCLKKAKILEDLRVGRNQFANNAIRSLVSVFSGPTTLKLLDVGNDFYVEPATAKVIDKLLAKNPEVTLLYKTRLYPNPPEPVDLKSIAINRCRYLAQKPKRKKLRRDMGHFMFQLAALESSLLKPDTFVDLLQNFKAKLDASLVDFLVKQFMTKAKKAKRVNVHEMAEYYLERYPTEPPQPKPEKKKQSKRKARK